MRGPDLSPRVVELDVGYINGMLGVEFTAGEVKSLLEKMRYGVDVKGGRLKVRVPPYRADVLHPIDLVEDVAIAHGYMKFKPTVPKLHGLGKPDPQEAYFEEVRDIMVGLQFREVMTLLLSNARDLFERMNAPVEPAAEALKPVSLEQSTARTWLLPSLMVVLEKNRDSEYPQRIFEVGEVISGAGETSVKVACVIAHSRTNYSEIKAVVGGLIGSLRLGDKDAPARHPSFIDGRCGGNKYGFWGELKPEVLSNFGLEVPVTAFEFRLS